MGLKQSKIPIEDETQEFLITNIISCTLDNEQYQYILTKPKKIIIQTEDTLIT